MALVFAVIAAVVVFLAGLFSDARISTACLRGLVSFLCAGAFTYLVTFILEVKGWAAYDKEPAERMQDMQAHLYNVDDIDFNPADDPSGREAAAEFAAPKHFQPLAEDAFVHMRTPSAADRATTGGAPAA